LLMMMRSVVSAANDDAPSTTCVVPQSLWHYNPLTLWYMTSQQNIQSLPILEDFRFATSFHKPHLIHMTTSEESLRVLFFTCSLAVDLVH
jgi:hypothetical protein